MLNYFTLQKKVLGFDVVNKPKSYCLSISNDNKVLLRPTLHGHDRMLSVIEGGSVLEEVLS